MKSTINKPNFRLFWELLRKEVNYHPDYQKDLKDNIVREYSGGRTVSLNEMYTKYPKMYYNMITSLKERHNQTPQAKRAYDPEGDLWRKRCIAVVCSWLDRQGLVLEPKQKVGYAIGVITRASNCRDFNKIPSSRLMEIYSLFLKRNDVNPAAADDAILTLEAEQYLEQIKQTHKI